MSLIITIIFSVIICIVAYLYYKPLGKLKSVVSFLRNNASIDIIEKSDPQIGKIYKRYLSHANISIDGYSTKKTLEHADEYFNEVFVCQAEGINLKHISAAPGVISGLGVLGTFFGLALSVYAFNSNNAEAIMMSIKTLLGGMGTAFVTSIIGMFLSSIYIYVQKKTINDFQECLDDLCNNLDDQFFISATEVSDTKFTTFLNKVVESIKGTAIDNREKQECIISALNSIHMQLEDNMSQIVSRLTTNDEEENEISLADITLALYEESEKQSQALESFTTDLSNELNASLGKTMGESVVPLIKNLERSHELFNEKLDTLSDNISKPTTDMVTNIVSDLKTSMMDISSEFRETISSQSVKQFESLAEKLATTSNMLNMLPDTMNKMAEKVEDNFDKVNDIVGKIQYSFEEHQLQMLDKTKTINEDMADSMKTKFEEITKTLAETVEIISQKQNSMADGQNRATREIERLLVSFDESIDKMKSGNKEVVNTLARVQAITENIDTTMERVKTLSDVITEIANELKGQEEANLHQFKQIQEGNQDAIESLQEAFENAKNTLAKYIEQYDIIDNGLKDIFANIKDGLQEYSKTLRKSTGEVLGEYSSALTNSTKGLQNIAEMLSNSVEEMSDSLENLKMFRR